MGWRTPLHPPLELPVGPRVALSSGEDGVQAGAGSLRSAGGCGGFPGLSPFVGWKPSSLCPAPMGCPPGKSTGRRPQARGSQDVKTGSGLCLPSRLGFSGPPARGHHICCLLQGRGYSAPTLRMRKPRLREKLPGCGFEPRSDRETPTSSGVLKRREPQGPLLATNGSPFARLVRPRCALEGVRGASFVFGISQHG